MAGMHPQFLRSNFKTWKVLATVFVAGWGLKLALYGLTKNKMDEVNEAQEKLIQQTLAKQRLTTDPVQELDMDAVHSMVAQQAALWKARDKARGVVPEPRE